MVRIKRHCTCRIAWPMAVCNDLATLLPECACTLAILLTKAVLISTRKRSPAFSISEALWVTQLRRQAQEYLVTLCSHSHKSQGGAPEPPHLRSSTKSGLTVREAEQSREEGARVCRTEEDKTRQKGGTGALRKSTLEHWLGDPSHGDFSCTPKQSQDTRNRVINGTGQ